MGYTPSTKGKIPLKLILHLGLYKTASTAIQKGLRELGAPDFAFFGLSELSRMRWLEDDYISKVLIRELQNGRSIVISDETIMGDIIDFYRDAEFRLTRIKYLLPIYDFSNLDIRVVVSIRNQIPWIDSAVREIFKWPKLYSEDTFYESLLNSSRFLKWEVLVTLIEKIFGSACLRVLPYTESTDFLDLFSNEIGFDIPKFKTNINASLSNLEIDMLRKEKNVNRREKLLDVFKLHKMNSLKVDTSISEKNNYISVLPSEIMTWALETFRHDIAVVSGRYRLIKPEHSMHWHKYSLEHLKYSAYVDDINMRGDFLEQSLVYYDNSKKRKLIKNTLLRKFQHYKRHGC